VNNIQSSGKAGPSLIMHVGQKGRRILFLISRLTASGVPKSYLPNTPSVMLSLTITGPMISEYQPHFLLQVVWHINQYKVTSLPSLPSLPRTIAQLRNLSKELKPKATTTSARPETTPLTYHDEELYDITTPLATHRAMAAGPPRIMSPVVIPQYILSPPRVVLLG
jgi:hypothetical protein